MSEYQILHLVIMLLQLLLTAINVSDNLHKK